MPKNKDLKKLVRARMEKTGEAYTTARARLTAAPKHERIDYAALAGRSDEAIGRATGRGWAEWVRYLDEKGARNLPHGDIADLARMPGVSGWWAQSVAVGYERIRGLREANQQRNGEYRASKSRTFAAPVSALYAAWAEKRKRARWLPGVALTVRTSIEDKSMRITWPDGTNVELYFSAKGPHKSALTVEHRKLASREAVAQAKTDWATRLDALAEALVAGR